MQCEHAGEYAGEYAGGLRSARVPACSAATHLREAIEPSEASTTTGNSGSMGTLGDVR